jgi:hypothetical protein
MNIDQQWVEHEKRELDAERRRWRFEAACAALPVLLPAAKALGIDETIKAAVKAADKLLAELDRSEGTDV